MLRVSQKLRAQVSLHLPLRTIKFCFCTLLFAVIVNVDCDKHTLTRGALWSTVTVVVRVRTPVIDR